VHLIFFILIFQKEQNGLNTVEILLLAVALAMDAFAVAICKGLALKKCTLDRMLIVGAWFGGFQALMPLLGYALGQTFSSVIETWSSFIAFGLLLLIGINMIREALSDEEEEASCDMCPRVMFPLALATSIDAMASGVALSMKNANILVSILIIGIVTFLLSMLGVKVGNVFGTKYKKKAELAGGIILCLLGIKTLLEHFAILF
jgi:putative Mn2+ efflux pump MntP